MILSQTHVEKLAEQSCNGKSNTIYEHLEKIFIVMKAFLNHSSVTALFHGCAIVMLTVVKLIDHTNVVCV